MTTPAPTPPAPAEITRLRDLRPDQWNSGIAAILGWLFDGLDMHLYTLVATPFVAQLLLAENSRLDGDQTSGIIMAAFLLGWAVGGGFFGLIGDKVGRSRALMLTILTYACFTGLSFFVQTWWQLMICRFLAALGIGGEWAVGASLLCETWPKSWRPWMAAVLQSGVNLGVMLACVAGWLLAGFEYRYVFLVGIVPAFFVLWIRVNVPESADWHAAQASNTTVQPSIAALFRGSLRRTTVMTIIVCSFALTAHWAFMFWGTQQLRTLPEALTWTVDERNRLVSTAFFLLNFASVLGNFLAGGLAVRIGYRRAIVLLCVTYCTFMIACYSVERTYQGMLVWLFLIGLCQGMFALFTMFLPPLFPTLVRTTGAGFCYNIGRIAAAGGMIFFTFVSAVGDQRSALFFTSFLFLPAAAVALFMPDQPVDDTVPTPLETASPVLLPVVQPVE